MSFDYAAFQREYDRRNAAGELECDHGNVPPCALCGEEPAVDGAIGPNCRTMLEADFGMVE